MNKQKKIAQQLKALKDKHNELENNIDSFLKMGNSLDQLMLQRFKRKKLQIKDKIDSLNQNLYEDIIA